MPTYASVLTEIGRAQLIDSQVTGTSLIWSKMAVGDGNGSPVTPVSSRTALVRERYRGLISSLIVDPADATQVIADLVIQPQDGGWTLREFGIFDSEERLVVYGSLPEIVKPVLSEGSGVTMTIRVRASVGNDAHIELSVDPTLILATRDYVDSNAIRDISIAGQIITITYGDGRQKTLTTQDDDTTYPEATENNAGLMSASDKAKLDALATILDSGESGQVLIRSGNSFIWMDLEKIIVDPTDQ